MGESRVMHSAERVMRALCSLRRRILPIALALFPGALVLHLDRVTRVLQVPAFQLDDFPSGYHVRTCLKCAEDLNRLRKPSSGESVQQLWFANVLLRRPVVRCSMLVNVGRNFPTRRKP
jgi:hypothetical protein